MKIKVLFVHDRPLRNSFFFCQVPLNPNFKVEVVSFATVTKLDSEQEGKMKNEAGEEVFKVSSSETLPSNPDIEWSRRNKAEKALFSKDAIFGNAFFATALGPGRCAGEPIRKMVHPQCPPLLFSIFVLPTFFKSRHATIFSKMTTDTRRINPHFNDRHIQYNDRHTMNLI